MRDAFIKKLTKMAEEDENIFLLTGDLGFSVLEDFQKKFPNRFVNVGVAEQTLVGAAAGLALSGKTVFIYSIATFATMRAFEQIRNDICYHNLKVRIVGVGSGFSYPPYGVTHHSLSDMGIMRCIPNMKIVAPGDPVEVEKFMDISKEEDGPVYLRLGKRGEPRMHGDEVDFKIGKGIVIKEGCDVSLISCGNMLETTFAVSKRLEEKGISTKLISMHTIKPIDKELVIKSAQETRGIYTIEEHNIIGGLGSAVAEVLSESLGNVKFRRFGVDDKFCEVAGDREHVRNLFGISEDKIVERILKDLEKND